MKKLLLVLLFVPLIVSCTKDGDSLIDPIIGTWKSEPIDTFDGRYEVTINTFSSNGILTGYTEEIKDGNVLASVSDTGIWKNIGSDFEAQEQTYLIGVGDENDSEYFEEQVKIRFSINFKQMTPNDGATFIKQ